MEKSEEANDLKKQFILVKGDISGIQEFIFNVKSKGAAKSLKGRSFFMKVLTEITIRYLFEMFGVNESLRSDYRISTSGGNFFLKLPLIENTDTLIQNSQLLLAKSLRYSGINLCLNWVVLSELNYKVNLAELNQKIRISKLSLFSKLTETDFNDFFSPRDKKHFDDIDDNHKWTEITDKLRACRFISIESTTQIDLKIINGSIDLIGYRCKFHNDENEPHRIPVANYLESIFPLKEVNHVWYPKEFEDLAKVWKAGDIKLGILKMDVDNLGTTLENIQNIENHKEFDLKLRQFFNDELRQMITDPTFFGKYEPNPFVNNVYTVTAGGDDSFFVGNWRVILYLAETINNQFSRNTFFKNKNLSISAGYIIVNPKFPVIRFSQLAEEALHKAKYKYEKGNICLFDEVITWEILDEIKDFKHQLAQGVTDKSKGLLAKARQSAIRGIEDDQLSLKENWEIAYYLREHKDKTIVKKIRDNFIKSTNVVGNNLKIQQMKRNLRLILPIAARLTELENR